MSSENKQCFETVLSPDQKAEWKNFCNTQNYSTQKCCFQNINLNDVVNNKCVHVSKFANYKNALEELYPGSYSIDCYGNPITETFLLITLLAFLFF